MEAHRGGRGARRHDQGGRVGHAEAAHRGGRGPAPGRHRPRRRGDRRRQQVPPRPRSPTSTSATSTTSSVREQQLARLAAAAGEPRRRPRARPRSTRCAEGAAATATCSSCPSTPPGPAPPSARSPTRSKSVFSRHRATIRSIAGVYGAAYEGDEEFEQVRARRSTSSPRAEGRRPRILVVKLGQDGHDRGAKVIATAFADLGFDVDVGPLFQTPEEAARDAIENDVHVVGVSSQAAGHKTLVPELIAQLRKQGGDDILVVVGGVIPAQDYDELREAGVAAIFGPGTNIPQGRRRDRRAPPPRLTPDETVVSEHGPVKRASSRAGDRRRPARARPRDHARRVDARRSPRRRRRAARRGAAPRRRRDPRRDLGAPGAGKSTFIEALGLSPRRARATASRCSPSIRRARAAAARSSATRRGWSSSPARRTRSCGRRRPAARSAASPAARARRCCCARPRASTSCSSRRSASGSRR